jgi:hypothetical protein
MVVPDPFHRAGVKGISAEYPVKLPLGKLQQSEILQFFAAFANPTPAEARFALMPTHQPSGCMK